MACCWCLFNWTITLIGAAICTRGAFYLWKIIEEIYILKELNLLERYGKDTWALVTGGTDGIGLGFARQLAKRGFNVIIAARTQKKLDKRKREIQKEFPGSKVETLQADFSKIHEDGFTDRIKKELSQYKLSVLVNNVGIGTKGTSFLEASQEKVHMMVDVNCTTQVVITKIFLELTEERKQKGAIIDLASIASLAPMRAKEIYSATKVFNRRYSITEGYVLREKYDRLAVLPGFVTTPLTDNRKEDKITCNVDECVNGSLKALGQRTQTYGSTKHIIFGSVLQTLFWLIPYKLLNSTIADLFYKGFKYNPTKKHD